jgi:hypothetical protein
MREDMAKVIVERPRKKDFAWNKPKGYLRRLQRYGEDGPPAREGIEARWQGGTKSLNEHLGPLRRYLDSQVGRPWDKVFSEICAHINRNSTVQDHVRDHVEDYVTRHVLLIDGVLCSGEPGYRYGKPLTENSWRPWYVCPRTGLLRRIPAKKRRQRREPKCSKRPKPPEYIRVSDTLVCCYRKGGWDLVTVRPLPPRSVLESYSSAIDVILNRRTTEITPAQARSLYGAEVYAVSSRRLSRSEQRQYPIPIEWVR